MKDVRYKRGVSLEQLSELTGITTERLIAFEADIETPDSTALLDIAGALRVVIALFFVEPEGMNYKERRQQRLLYGELS